MKRGFIIVIFLGIAVFTANAQDYMILKSGEKIDCKIQKTDSVNVYFSVIKREQTVNSFLAKGDIREYGSYSKFNAVQAEKIITEKTATRISFFGGGGYILTFTFKYQLV